MGAEALAMIVAHRVNTVDQLFEALKAGIAAIEMDVHTRYDGESVVWHDYDKSGAYDNAMPLDRFIPHVPPHIHVYVEIKQQSYTAGTTHRIKDLMRHRHWTPISFSRQIAQSFNMPYGWISTDPAIIDHQAALMIVSKDNVTQPLPALRNGAKWMVYTCNTQADVDRMRAMGADYIETDDVCLQ
jgi:hypothetical protein